MQQTNSKKELELAERLKKAPFRVAGKEISALQKVAARSEFASSYAHLFPLTSKQFGYVKAYRSFLVRARWSKPKPYEGMSLITQLLLERLAEESLNGHREV